MSVCDNNEVARPRPRQGKQVNYIQDNSFLLRKKEDLSWVGF